MPKIDVTLTALICAISLILVVRTYRRATAATKPHLELAALVQEFHKELDRATIPEAQQKLLFRVKTVEIEVNVVVTESATTKGSFVIEPVTAEQSLTNSSERVHKIKLQLEPLPPVEVEEPATNEKNSKE
ncbi:MAG TPA: trypco2 family protein [Thermoanaerobaculia bacterium]|jgi:hypothetical protein|nr:trypco2 family protein [Thermoanaerobaculia bacterium]